MGQVIDVLFFSWGLVLVCKDSMCKNKGCPPLNKDLRLKQKRRGFCSKTTHNLTAANRMFVVVL